MVAKKVKEGGQKRLVLLDAHAILHRAYHALPDFSTSKGEPTGALYGLSTMLIKIIGELKPDYMAACYDLPGPTYRHEAYKEYKAGRKKADEDLVAQMISSKKVFKAFSIPIYEHPGFEADDCLGTIVHQVKGKMDVIIASGDMDTLQLVDDERVRVYTLKKGIQDTILYDEKGVKERFGFGPELLPDYKGLRGDPSDNIIGIPGIGEKTATELIVEFGSIEEIYKKLKKDKKVFERKGIKARVIDLLLSHEEEALFSKMLASIRTDAPIKYEVPDKEWKEQVSVDSLEELFSELEFRALRTRIQTLFGKREEFHQSSFNEISNEKIDPKKLQEARVALWLINSTLTNPTIDDIFHFAKTKDFDKAYSLIGETLIKNNLVEVFETIEKPIIPIVEKMEERGITVDTKYLIDLSKEYHKELNKREKKIFSLAGEEFNINSPKQLSVILFEKLGLAIKGHKKTEGGVKSTRESELEKLREGNPIIEEILAYRELQKLLSTYIDTIPRMLDKKSRLHARFVQTGTTTGRMSSQDPNLQNIPIKTELGRQIRYAFVASKGYKLVALDYSQIELRVAAFLSEDPKLISIFKGGGDIHAAVASEVFGVSIDSVTKEMRRKAKVINFGILYGMGVNALRANLGGTREEAQKFYNEYFKSFSGLATYLDRVKAEAARKGYTETLFGRRRYFEGIKSKIPYIKASAERMAINAPIQGTQSDIIKKAMIAIWNFFKDKRIEDKAYLLLQVHDELVFEIENNEVESLTPEIKRIMETIIPLSMTKDIPLSVAASVGDNWGDMKSL